jgi:threonine dehydrogenase-like Zn-dependent dehydrogenase
MITLMETWSWLELFEVSEKTSVLIWGLGPVGLAMSSCCKAMNTPLVIGLDIDDKALKRSADYGVDVAINAASDDLNEQVKKATGGKGVNRIIEAVGNRNLVTQSESLVSDFGRIGIYGIEPTISGIKPKPYQLSALGQYSIHFFYPNEMSAQNKVIEQYRKGNLDPAGFITNRFNLDKVQTAFETVSKKQSLKTIIEM